MQVIRDKQFVYRTNIETNEIVTYASLSDACRSNGIATSTLSNASRSHRIINDKFIFSYEKPTPEKIKAWAEYSKRHFMPLYPYTRVDMPNSRTRTAQKVASDLDPAVKLNMYACSLMNVIPGQKYKCEGKTYTITPLFTFNDEPAYNFINKKLEQVKLVKLGTYIVKKTKVRPELFVLSDFYARKVMNDVKLDPLMTLQQLLEMWLNESNDTEIGDILAKRLNVDVEEQ